MRVFLFLLFIAQSSLVAFANENCFIRIGTASISGIYYSTGNAVCKLLKKELNEKSEDNKNEDIIHCSVQSTPGAMYNLNALRNRDLEIAIAQSDWESNALFKKGAFKNLEPMHNLRSIFTTHKEAFSVMVRSSSGIDKFDDIKGKIVNIGAPGTGVRSTIEDILKSKGWSFKDFKVATELSSSEQAQALCDGKIDVMLSVIGHPNGLFQEASATCNTKFIPLDRSDITKLVESYDYYTDYTIDTEAYLGAPGTIDTISVSSTFYTLSEFPEDKVYDIVKSVFSNFSTLKSVHPAFYGLKKADLLPKSRAPIHDGAIKYYKSIGLI